MAKFFKFLSLVVVSCILFACGFKADTTSSLPPQLLNIYVEAVDQYHPFVLSIKRSLKAAGASLAISSEKSQVILKVISINLHHNNPNITASNQASVYDFTYEVIFALQNKKGSNLIEPQKLVVSRVLTLNPNEILSVSGEVDIMKAEMNKELISQLFDRLNSANVTKKF